MDFNRALHLDNHSTFHRTYLAKNPEDLNILIHHLANLVDLFNLVITWRSSPPA